MSRGINHCSGNRSLTPIIAQWGLPSWTVVSQTNLVLVNLARVGRCYSSPNSWPPIRDAILDRCPSRLSAWSSEFLGYLIPSYLPNKSSHFLYLLALSSLTPLWPDLSLRDDLLLLGHHAFPHAYMLSMKPIAYI